MTFETAWYDNEKNWFEFGLCSKRVVDVWGEFANKYNIAAAAIEQLCNLMAKISRDRFSEWKKYSNNTINT